MIYINFNMGSANDNLQMMPAIGGQAHGRKVERLVTVIHFAKMHALGSDMSIVNPADNPGC